MSLFVFFRPSVQEREARVPQADLGCGKLEGRCCALLGCQEVEHCPSVVFVCVCVFVCVNSIIPVAYARARTHTHTARAAEVAMATEKQ